MNFIDLLKIHYLHLLSPRMEVSEVTLPWREMPCATVTNAVKSDFLVLVKIIFNLGDLLATA